MRAFCSLLSAGSAEIFGGGQVLVKFNCRRERRTTGFSSTCGVGLCNGFSMAGQRPAALMGVRDILCASFIRQAARTWDFLAEGAAYKLLPGEETLTDINLIELKRNVSPWVFTEKFTRYREGTETGADWEWWIADEDGWLGLRIQAKRLDPYTQRYEPFAADPSKALDQADQLIEAAADQAVPLYPVYCFYNANCQVGSVPKCAGASGRRVFGCSLASAPQVRSLVARGARTYGEFAPYTQPWSCLFCEQGEGGSLDLTIRAKRVLDGDLFADFEEQRGQIDDEVPEHVELVWRIDRPLLGPEEIDPRAVPDVSHVLLTTALPRRPA
jgi:hypothetical protein